MIPETSPSAMRLATADVRAELARVDTKASTLLTLAGTALTVGLAVLARAGLPSAAAFTGWVTVSVIGAAVAVLAAAVRPALRGDYGFMRYAHTTAGDVMTEFADAGQARRCAVDAHGLVWLSKATHRKYRRVRTAVDLLMAGLAGTAVTAVLAALH